MYKKIRYFVRFSQALVAKYYLAILLGLTLAVSLIFAFPYLISRLPQFNSQKRIALVGRYTLSNLPLSVQEKISIGLTSIDSQGVPKPALATSWTATDSGRTYIFNLNTNLKWQDGTPIKSRDIKYNFRDADVLYPDDSRLIIKMRDPYSPLPSVVSRPVFKSATTRLSRLFPPFYSGIGSYRIKSYRKNGTILDSLTLSRVKSDADLPNLKYYFYSSPDQARIAYKLGLVDQIADLPDIGDLQNWPNTQITTQTWYDRYVSILFDTQNPDLEGSAGKNLRLALNYAIDKSRWPDRAIGPISPASWAYNPNLKKYDRDLTRAKTLLKNVDKIPDQITLNTVPAYLSDAQNIQSDWQQLGLKVNLQVSPDIPATFEALLIAQAIPIDPDQYNLWHSTQEGTNLTHLKNPRIDKLLEDGRKTFDLSARKLIYADFQRFLLEDSPAVFLYYPHTYAISRH